MHGKVEAGAGGQARVRGGEAPAEARAPSPRIVAWFRAWLERRRQRLWLAALDGRALRDIGLERAQVRDDSQRPGWTSGPLGPCVPPPSSSARRR